MSDPIRDLHDVAESASTRIAMARWTELLDRSALPLFVGTGAALVGLRLAGYGLGWKLALVGGGTLVGVWLLSTLIAAFIARPPALTALARWDEKAGRAELFTSALSFVREGAEGPAVELHIQRAAAELPEARKALPRELSYYVSNPSWLAPILFLAFLSTGLLEAPPAVAGPKDGLSEEERERAAAAGEQLEERADALDPKNLTPEEQAELDKIKQELKKTAKKLKQPGQEATQREVLAELERRARQAEKLARKMGADQREKISGGMLAELERHADTAELAGALRGNEYDLAAGESKRLGEKLGSPDLGIEARQRIQEAFNKGLAAASQQDKLTRLGKRLAKAHEELVKKEPAKAGVELLQLAEFYAKLAERLKKQKQLRNLAKRLRELGQETMGKQQQGLKRLAQNQPSLPDDGMRRLTTDRDFSDLPELPPMDEGAPPAPPSEDPLQDLLPDEAMPGQGPIPGQAPAPIPGQQPGGNPIPGQWPGGQRPGGGAPVPGGQGGNQGGQGAQPGGNNAGNGAAGMGNKATKTMESTSTEVVSGRKGKGPSAMRRRAGRGHREGAGEDTKAIASDFIKAEEAALADEPLPASRRHQVRRYFTAIRKLLEPQGEAPPK